MRVRSAGITFLLLMIFGIPSAMAQPVTKLLLFGGAERPAAAMKLFAQWAGGDQATVLIIGWESEIPQVYFDSISAELKAEGVKTILPALKRPTAQAEFDFFEQQRKSATAIFWTGGKQDLALDVVDLWALRPTFKQMYANGIPFAGTSAGDNIASEVAIVSNTRTRQGLGFLEQVMSDSHFLQRKRETRLLRALRANHIPYGIGVSENSAVAIIHNTFATVFGDCNSVFYPRSDAGYDRIELRNTETINLSHHQ